MRRMGIGLGVGINRSNYAQGIFGAYATRVVADGGVVEGGACVDAVSSLLQSASLLLIPSGYKGGKLYAEIPTNGNGDLTWTRGSDAFRTNASGLLQRVPWNLFQQSETFENASWNKTNITLSTNATNAPNGTLTAEKAIQATGLSEHYLRQQVNSLTGVYTASIYAKKAELDFLILWEDVTTGKRACFNLSNGTIGLTSNSPNATITNVGDGWYRCTIEATLSSQGFGLYVAPSQTNTLLGVSQTGNGTSGIFIWGAQLVEGTTAQTYLPTTDRLNFPRLSYMYGSCPAVLLEPQRTNLALRSEEFDNASWAKVNTSISANTTATLDPMGGNNADKFVANNNNAAHHISQSGFTSSAYSFTVYAKAAEETTMSLWLRNAAVGATFNLSNGTVSNISVTSATITSIGNGWYRCFVYDSTAGTTANIYGRGGSGYVGNNVDGFYIYGAQLEAGAYPTTYIPTTSATATRVADSFSRNNIFTNGLISASGGTWFVELRNNIVYTRDTASYGLAISDQTTPSIGGGASGNTLAIIRTSTSSVRLQIIKQESLTFTSLYTTLTDTVKIAIKWNGSTADVFVNGTKQVSATTFTATSMQNLLCLATDVPRFIQQMALFPTPLSDTDCTTLTTL